MKIYVRTLAGKIIPVDVEPKDTVLSVKQKIEAKEEFLVTRLIFAGKQLRDDFALSNYNICSGVTLDALIGSRPQPTSDESTPIPTESVFPKASEAFQTIEEWQKLAEKGGFDADTHIVAPEAHFVALQSLEHTVTTCSELHRQHGTYKFSETPDVAALLANLLDSPIPSTVPEWVYDVMLEMQRDDLPSASKQVAAGLCQSFAIIQSVIDRFNLLVSKNFCSDFFSILLLTSEADVAEIVKIPRTILDRLREALLIALSLVFREKRDIITETVHTAVQEALTVLGYRNFAVDELEACRVIAYLLDLGLVCYVGSHGSRFDQEHFGLDTPSFSVNYDAEFGFECGLHRLACLHGFLDAKEVWAFHVHVSTQSRITPTSSTKRKLSILATIDALADIWGPVYAVLEENDASAQPARVKRYNVAKGCIRRVPGTNSSSTPGVVNCHWFSWAEEQRRRLSRILARAQAGAGGLTMALDDKLLVGTDMTINHDCTLSLDDYETTYEDLIRESGPRPSSWRFDGVAVSLQLAAPKVAVLQIEGQTKRVPEKTVKEMILHRWSMKPERANPVILNSYYGVEISNCTGNSRRVQLKEILLMGPVCELLERQIPGWSRTPWGLDFMKALRADSEDAIIHFWMQHTAERAQVGQLVSSVLDALNDTGMTDAGFQAAFLHRNSENIVSIETQHNDWTKLLKDSYCSATYAIVNEVCLEYRRPDHTTAVCNDEQRFSVFQTEIGMEKGADLGDHVKVRPGGLHFKKVDSGADALQSPHLLAPKTTLQILGHLMLRRIDARELVNQHPLDSTRGHKVVLRSSRTSYGGMAYQRARKALATTAAAAAAAAAAAEEDTQVTGMMANLAVEEDALSQMAIHAMICEDLENADREEDQRAAC